METERSEASKAKTYLFNAMLISPSIFLLLFGLSYALPDMNPYIYIPLFLLPLIKRLSPKLIRLNTYRLVVIIFLLLVLDTIFSRLAPNTPIVGGIGVPITFTTMFTVEICLGYLLVVESLFANKPYHVIGGMIASLALLGEIYAAIAFLNSPYFNEFVTGYGIVIGKFALGSISRLQMALIGVAVLEFAAITSLIFNGFMTFMPLYGGSPHSLVLPYSRLLLGLFGVSFIGVVGRFYVDGEKDETFRLEGLFYSVIMGVVISSIVVYFAGLFQGLDYQFMVISILVIIFLIISSASSRLTPKALKLEE